MKRKALDRSGYSRRRRLSAWRPRPRMSQPRDGVFIHVSHGSDDPHRLLMALNMANMMATDHDVLVYFDIKAVEVVLAGATDVAFAHFKPSGAQLAELKQKGVALMACPGCLKVAGKAPTDLAPGIVVADKARFFSFTKGRILTLDLLRAPGEGQLLIRAGVAACGRPVSEGRCVRWVHWINPGHWRARCSASTSGRLRLKLRNPSVSDPQPDPFQRDEHGHQSRQRRPEATAEEDRPAIASVLASLRTKRTDGDAMTKLAASTVRDTFAETLNRVAYRGERIVLRRHGKDLAAIVSIEDLALIERLARPDRRPQGENGAVARLKKGNKPIPIEKLKRDLGLYTAYRVLVDDRAAREIRNLPKEVQGRVVAKVETLARNPRPSGCQKLRGMEDLYRVRLGDYRIVYRVEDDVVLVLVVSVGARGEVYERLRRKR